MNKEYKVYFENLAYGTTARRLNVLDLELKSELELKEEIKSIDKKIYDKLNRFIAIYNKWIDSAIEMNKEIDGLEYDKDVRQKYVQRCRKRDEERKELIAMLDEHEQSSQFTNKH